MPYASLPRATIGMKNPQEKSHMEENTLMHWYTGMLHCTCEVKI